ncbi:MAG: HEAT repeat domain-containing protein [Deltaproteobacteria bacterium]|nr:HEAT repeat domain-containing protein [Deltaproteobacteria bacterium]
MSTKTLPGRSIKRKAYEILNSKDVESAIEDLCRLPLRQVINSLFPLLYGGDLEIKWRAVMAMGAVVARLAREDIESARVIIRRLMWNLNDESGGIGWGSPEAMGEILANSNALAGEYSKILVSYARKDGNYQENEIMQRGVLWGIGRLAQVNPELIKGSVPYITPYLESSDATVRGLAGWIMGLLGTEDASSRLETLTGAEAEIQVFMDGRLVNLRVKDMAAEALRRIGR